MTLATASPPPRDVSAPSGILLLVALWGAFYLLLIGDWPMSNAQSVAAEAKRFWRELKAPTVDLSRADSSEYLSGLSPSIITEPVMKGTDGTRRPFIAFRVVLMDNWNPEDPLREDLILTAHQRYSDHEWPWVMAGGDARTDPLLGLPYPDLDGIKRLLAGETLTNDECRCTIRLGSSSAD